MKNNEKISETLQIIANILYINQHKIRYIGLLNGKMGVAIYLYHYARYSGCNVYEELADDYIDDIINNKTDARHPNFPGGISGLAWGFNYLIENNYIEIEDNMVLDDLDSYLFNNISIKISNPFLNNFTLFGNGLYYTSKIKRQAINEKNMIAIETLLEKCQIIIKDCKENFIFDIKYFNSLLYFLTEIAKNFPIKKKTVSRLLSDISNILLKQTDYSIYNDEDIYILQKNIEQVCLLTSKKDKWNQIQLKLPNRPLSVLTCFNWQNFIYFSFNNMQIDDFLLDEIEDFIEQKLDYLLDTDFVLSGTLLNIGIGLLRNVQ